MTATHALGEFLRLMRDRAAAPAHAQSTRRRARGLRREEVALAAGISVTWYTWLEQGRTARVSRDTLLSIADALHLDVIARAHLLNLADAAATPVAAPPVTTSADDTIRRVVEALCPHAAYAINARWDVLCANAPANALLGDFFSRPGITDNVMRRLFLDDDWRERFEEWSIVAESAVAQFRAATGSHTATAALHSFVARLASESREFAAFWSRHELAESPTREKVFLHPVRGRLRLLYVSLASDVAADVRIIAYLPVRAASTNLATAGLLASELQSPEET